MKKVEFSLKAEPNWRLFGDEGGLPNSQYDEFVRVYCDLASKSTFAVSVADGLQTLLGDGLVYAEGQGPDLRSWCGYEWSQSGECFMLSYGPDADDHWWSIDDLLFGAFDECYFSVVDPETHEVARPEQIVESCRNSGLLAPLAAAAQAIAYWWSDLTPAQEVELGLTAAELIEEAESCRSILDSFRRG